MKDKKHTKSPHFRFNISDRIFLQIIGGDDTIDLRWNHLVIHNLSEIAIDQQSVVWVLYVLHINSLCGWGEYFNLALREIDFCQRLDLITL